MRDNKCGRITVRPHFFCPPRLPLQGRKPAQSSKPAVFLPCPSSLGHDQSSCYAILLHSKLAADGRTVTLFTSGSPPSARPLQVSSSRNLYNVPVSGGVRGSCGRGAGRSADDYCASGSMVMWRVDRVPQPLRFVGQTSGRAAGRGGRRYFIV